MEEKLKEAVGKPRSYIRAQGYTSNTDDGLYARNWDSRRLAPKSPVH